MEMSNLPDQKARLHSENGLGPKATPSRSAAKSPKIKFYLNRTFLDVHDSDFEPPQTSRARSDPGTEFSSESTSTDANKFWQQEMELLSNHMHQIWQERCSDSSSLAGDASDSSSDSSSDGTRADSEARFSRCSSNLQDLTDPSSRVARPEGAAAMVTTDLCLSGFEPVRLPYEHNVMFGRRHRPLSQAQAAIAEVPKQVRSFSEQTANKFVGNMEERFQEMRTVQASNNVFHGNKAVGKLDAVPGIFNSFEASFAHTDDMVQLKVDGVLAQPGDDSQAVLAFQANAIPKASTAPSALGAAVLECPAGPTSARLSTGPFSQWNPGSLGHPELCPRPCLYFARGSCASDANCEYCHLEHSKKPSHLTKRNRETLKAARSEELLALSLPLLREKVGKLGLNPDVLPVLDEVAGRVRIQRTRALQKLGDALGTLQLRILLTTLQRSMHDNASAEHAELRGYVDRIRMLVLPRIPGGVLDDSPDLDEM